MTIKDLTPIAFANIGHGIVYVYHVDEETGTVVYARRDGQAVGTNISKPKTSEAFFMVSSEDEAWPVHIYELAWCQDPQVYEENEKYFGEGQK